MSEGQGDSAIEERHKEARLTFSKTSTDKPQSFQDSIKWKDETKVESSALVSLQAMK